MESSTLHTERLVLLQLGPADLDETAALYGDPEVMRDVAGGMKDRAQTAEMLEKVAESWRVRGYGLWAIRDSASGASILITGPLSSRWSNQACQRCFERASISG